MARLLSPGLLLLLSQHLALDNQDCHLHVSTLDNISNCLQNCSFAHDMLSHPEALAALPLCLLPSGLLLPVSARTLDARAGPPGVPR